MASLHLLSPRGFTASAVAAGIKRSGKLDVGLLTCASPVTAAAVFTTNRVFAAPIKVGRAHIAGGKLQAIVVNSGNANACTGKRGYGDAMTMCRLAADALGCSPTAVLPSSTGIIGHLLPMKKIRTGIAAAAAGLGNSRQHATDFMDAILTTDLKRKSAAVEFKIGRETVRLAGVCKGSGMIGPRMATMLAYLTTDVAAAPPLLRKLLSVAADESFNCVTVDDHASTNDTAVLLASGQSGARLDSSAASKKFAAALREVTQSLAWQIAADGEGATKVVKIVVTGASNVAAAKAIARAMANSPLVKCAMHGNDPNWGRLVSAAGYAGVPFDPDKAALKLQGTVVFRNGTPMKFDSAKVSAALRASEVTAELKCGGGMGHATIWTCDLSKEYVTINADYHT
jgi:glutamate N-acetyltransferase/amino-acid N-acetyltransferase